MNKIIFNVLVLLTLTHGAWVDAAAPVADSAPALLARYELLKVQLANNPFQLPLYLDSKQHSGDLRGDIFAVVDHPFATVSTSVRLADQWCAILLLHLNVKYCRATQGGSKLAV